MEALIHPLQRCWDRLCRRIYPPEKVRERDVRWVEVLVVGEQRKAVRTRDDLHMLVQSTAASLRSTVVHDKVFIWHPLQHFPSRSEVDAIEALRLPLKRIHGDDEVLGPEDREAVQNEKVRVLNGRHSQFWICIGEVASRAIFWNCFERGVFGRTGCRGLRRQCRTYAEFELQ